MQLGETWLSVGVGVYSSALVELVLCDRIVGHTGPLLDVERSLRTPWTERCTMILVLQRGFYLRLAFPIGRMVELRLCYGFRALWWKASRVIDGTAQYLRACTNEKLYLGIAEQRFNGQGIVMHFFDEVRQSESGIPSSAAIDVVISLTSTSIRSRPRLSL